MDGIRVVGWRSGPHEFHCGSQRAKCENVYCCCCCCCCCCVCVCDFSLGALSVSEPIRDIGAMLLMIAKLPLGSLTVRRQELMVVMVCRAGGCGGNG